MLLNEMYQKLDLKNPACIIDANHANSNKCYYEQPRIISEVMHSRNVSPEIKKLVKGVMVESYIEPGNRLYMSIYMANPSQMHVLGGRSRKNLYMKLPVSCKKRTVSSARARIFHTRGKLLLRQYKTMSFS